MDDEPIKISTQIIKADPGWKLVTHLEADSDSPASLEYDPVIAYGIEVWENSTDRTTVFPIVVWGSPISGWWAWQHPDGRFQPKDECVFYDTEAELLGYFERMRKWAYEQSKKAAK